MVVPTYPEGGSPALQVCQHHHQVVRVGDFVGLSETGRTRCSRLLRPIRLKPSRSHSAHHGVRCATVKVAGGGPSVHACARCSFAQNRVMGINRAKPQTLYTQMNVRGVGMPVSIGVYLYGHAVLRDSLPCPRRTRRSSARVGRTARHTSPQTHTVPHHCHR